MSCLDDNVLSEHLARRLDAAGTAAVVAHLDECAACSDLLVDLARAQAPMRALAPSLTIADSVPRARPLEESAARTIGRYVVLAQVGSGGMGVVFAAYDPKLERKVAIKVLRSRAGADEVSQGAQRRLMSEARTMARLSHPNVLVVHDVGSHEGHVYLVADFVDGGTLKDWLARETRAPGEVMAAMVQAGRGLAAAHKAGLVHRDFKPDNVLVSQEGRVFVADFGLTSAAPAPGSEAGRANVAAGTPAYMAPEVQLGAVGDERSDQYSFCLTLHQALFGERPVAGASPDSLPSLASSSSASPVPEAVRAAMRRGLAFEAPQRFASMDELLSALAPFAALDEVLLRPSSAGAAPPVVAASSPRPSRARLVAAAVVALFMGAVVLVTVAGGHRTPSPPANVISASLTAAPAPPPSPVAMDTPAPIATTPERPPGEPAATAPAPAPARKRSRAQASAPSDPMGRHY